jgi:hypothetical protein
MAVDSSNDDLDLRAIVKVIVQRRWALCAAMLFGAAAGLVLALTTHEIYQANAILTFDSNRANSNQLSKPAKEYAESSHVIKNVLDGFGVKLEPITDRFSARSVDNQLYLRALGDTPEQAGALAKLWAEQVARGQTQQSESVVQSQREALQKALDDSRKELLDRQEKLTKFVKENDAFEKLEDFPIFDAYRSMMSDRSERVQEYNRLVAEQQLFAKPDVTPEDLLNSPRARKDSALGEFRKQLDALNIDRLSLAKADTDALHKIDERTATLRAAMLEAARNYAVQIRVDIDHAKLVLDQFEQKSQQLQKDMNKAKADFQAYSGLETDVKVAEKRYTEASQKFGEFELTSAALICKVVEDGTQNTDMYKKKEFKKYTILGLVAGLFIALLSIGFLEVIREEPVKV